MIDLLENQTLIPSDLAKSFKAHRWHGILRRSKWRDVVLETLVFDGGWIKARIRGYDCGGNRHEDTVRIWIGEMERMKNPDYLTRKIVRLIAAAVRRMYTGSLGRYKSFQR